jgi:DnaJ-class molecular chaperone
MRLGKDVLEADLYRVLGILPDATEAEIRVAYRRQVRASHPDLNQADPDAMSRMKRLNVAARVLLDPAMRRAYDRAPRAAKAARTSSRPPLRREWFERDEQSGETDWAAPAPAETRAHRSVFNGFFHELRGREGQLSLRVQEAVESLSTRQQLSVAALLFGVALGLIGMARAQLPDRSEPESAAMSTTGPRE